MVDQIKYLLVFSSNLLFLHLNFTCQPPQKSKYAACPLDDWRRLTPNWTEPNRAEWVSDCHRPTVWWPPLRNGWCGHCGGGGSSHNRRRVRRTGKQLVLSLSPPPTENSKVSGASVDRLSGCKTDKGIVLWRCIVTFKAGYFTFFHPCEVEYPVCSNYQWHWNYRL